MLNKMIQSKEDNQLPRFPISFMTHDKPDFKAVHHQILEYAYSTKLDLDLKTQILAKACYILGSSRDQCYAFSRLFNIFEDHSEFKNTNFVDACRKCLIWLVDTPKDLI